VDDFKEFQGRRRNTKERPGTAIVPSQRSVGFSKLTLRMDWQRRPGNFEILGVTPDPKVSVVLNEKRLCYEEDTTWSTRSLRSRIEQA
jgi:hypothetical protein